MGETGIPYMSSKYGKFMSLPHRQVNYSLTIAIQETNFGDSMGK